ncbi:MAG: hypothetical protein IH621_01150 [Krumholzibacteria bacterium]|nr:hypothetical protein [Candidatus Krumholzibacteria bacterium]
MVAAGSWLNLAPGGPLPPAYYQSAYTACGDAVVVRGRLVGGTWMTGVEVCPDQCWVPVQFVSELPAAPEPLVGTAAVVELRGTLTDEIEGPCVTGVTRWTVLPDCGTVPAVPGNWSGLKAAYR